MAILFSSSLFSTEIDSFTLRDSYMQDSLDEMNAMVQRYFEDAISKANKENSCKTEVFEKILHKLTGGLFWAQIESDIEKSEILDRRSIALARSIYRDISFIYAPALYLAPLGFVVKMGDLYIGSDKFGHFLDQGYDYYKLPTLEEGLEFGEMTERTYYGLTSTAVYSYADLAANLDGHSFWKQLTKGKDAYFNCSNNTWTQQRKFTWADYVNAAWDESLNCSYYRNDTVAAQVNQRIGELGMTCPIEKGRCAGMIKHYGYLAAHVVSQTCFN